MRWTRSETTQDCRQATLIFGLTFVGVSCSSNSPHQVHQECHNRFPAYSLTATDDAGHGHSHGHEDSESQQDGSGYVNAMGPFLPSRETVLPELLSQTILYRDIVAKEIHPALWHYTPAYQLWSDGEDKERWIYVPECSDIDTSDINDWQFPVGTRFFKEFSRDGKRVETRIITRIGIGPRDYAHASYQWNDEETEATRVSEEGVKNVNGTGHDIPSKSQCLACHGTYSYGGGRPSRGLGFSAIQLSHQDSETTLQGLIQAGRLSHPPVEDIGFPGDQTTKDALGYLHANCGNCHNDSKDGIPHNDLNLWVDAYETAEETGAYRTAVDQPNHAFRDQHVSGRVVPGHPDESSVFYRMTQRGNNAQMPSIATKEVDVVGSEMVRAWIESLP